MRRLLSVIALSAACSACAAPHYPPALPDPHLWPDEPPGFATPEQLHPAPMPLAPPLPPPVPPVVVSDALPPKKALKKKRQPPEKPEAVMREANTAALVTPTRVGYFGESALQRYIYQPGKVYLVVSSPSHPTTLFLPPGERLAAAPVV